MPRKPKTMPLIPADPERCQAEMRSFMTLGPGRNRCANAPVVIATEAKPGKDGLHGQMSLCEDCKRVFIQRLGPDFASFTPVPKG